MRQTLPDWDFRGCLRGLQVRTHGRVDLSEKDKLHQTHILLDGKVNVIDGMRFMEKLFERIISTRLNRLRVVSTRLIRYFRWLDTLEEATLGTRPKIQRSSGGNPRADRLDRGPIRTVQSCTRGGASAPSKSQTSRSPEARAVRTLGSPLEII